MKKIILLTVYATLSVCVYAQTVIYVRPGGNGNGRSWAEACDLKKATELADAATAAQAAVAKRKAPVVPVEIWVKAGTYYPAQTVVVGEKVHVYGGFDGTESQRSQRNFARNKTLIDAQKNFAVLELGKLSLVDGFTLQNGSAHTPNRRSGGGVWMKDLARVENCYILNNQALDDGGGIYSEAGGLVYNTVVAKNQARRDGVAIYGRALELRNNTVTDNELMLVGSLTPDSTTTEICAGDLAHLQVSDAGSYRWSSGQTTSQITTAPLTAPATYTVTVMPNDKSSVFELTFFVRTKALPSLQIIPSRSNANVGDSCLFKAVARPLGGTYSWEGFSLGNDSLVLAVMPAAGDLEYACTYTFDGCNVKEYSVVTNSRCTPSVMPDRLSTKKRDLCEGDSLILELQGGVRHSGTWVLYAGSCGGTKIDSSRLAAPSFGLKPMASTSYYVRGEGCGTQTACVSVDISVKASPTAITGEDSTCQNVPIQLLALPSGGIWQGDSLCDASPSAWITPHKAGKAKIRYTLPNACYRDFALEILPAPQYITGLDDFCAETASTYEGGDRKGGRYRIVPTTYASIDSITGLLTSVRIPIPEHKLKLFYADPINGCESHKELTIYQQPSPILGPLAACTGDTLHLTSATTPPGTWQSAQTTVADFLTDTSGLLLAKSEGTTQITYFSGRCLDTVNVRVLARPTPPLLAFPLCEASMVPVSMSALYEGGLWTIAPSTVATVDSVGPTAARLHGLAKGRFTLTYTLPNGCYSSVDDSVYATPVLTKTVTALGLNRRDTLRASLPGGNWQSSNSSVISVQGMGDYAILESNSIGTATLTYILPSSCQLSQKVSVAPCAVITPPANPTANPSLCSGAMLTPISFALTHATRVSWLWRDRSGAVVAQPLGITIDTLSTPQLVTLSGSIVDSGLYTYEIRTVDHFEGCGSGSFFVGKITVFSPMSGGHISGSQSLCQNEAPTPFANSQRASGGTGVGTYLWQRQPFSSASWQDMASSNSSSFTDFSHLTESHRYRRQYTNSCGQVFSDTLTVRIDSLPEVLSVMIDSNTGCAAGNGSIRLLLKDTAQVVIAIDGTTFVPQTFFSGLLAGTYLFDLRNATTGCVSDYSVELAHSDRDVPQLAIIGRDSICAADSTLWRVNIENKDGSPYDILWSRVGEPNKGTLDSLWLKGSSSSYTVLVTHRASSCKTSVSRVLTVMPRILITEFTYLGKGDTTLCVQGRLNFKVAATSSGLPRNYAWYRADDASFGTGVMRISQASEFSYSPTLPLTRYYKAVVTSPFGICPSVESPVITVTAVQKPKPLITGARAVCSGDKALLSVTPQSAWSYAWILGSDTLSKTHQLTALPNTSTSKYILHANNGYCSDTTAHTVDLRLRPSFTYADAASGQTQQSVCHNGAIAEIRAKLENARTVVIVWTAKPLNLFFDSVTLKLSGHVSEAPGIYPFFGYTIGQAAECPPDTVRGAITIRLPLDPGSITVPVSVCRGSIPDEFANETSAIGGAPDASYQWQQSTDGISWTDIVDATDESIQITTPLSQRHFYRRAFQNSCGIVYTLAHEVAVVDLPAKPTFDIDHNTNCSGGSNAMISVTAPSGASYVYKNLNGTYSNNPIFTPLSEGLHRISVKDLLTSCESSDTARILNIGAASNVPEFSVITNLPQGTDSVCTTNPSITLSANLIDNCDVPQYAWRKASDPSTVLSTAPSLTITATETSAIYTLEITNAGGCNAVQGRNVHLVQPLTIIAQPKNDTACGKQRNSTFSITVGNALSRPLSYQWQRKGENTSNWEMIGSNTHSYTTASADRDTSLLYRCWVQVQNSSICPALVSNEAHLRMLKVPTPIISGDTAICGGQDITLSAPAGFVSYAWALNGSPMGVSTPSLTTTPSSTSQVYRVFVNNGYCQGEGMITVNAYESSSIVPTNPSDRNVCLQGAIAPRRIEARHASGLQLQGWTKNGVSIVTPAKVTFVKISAGKTPTGVDTCLYELNAAFDEVGTYTYAVSTTGHAPSCPADTLEWTIVVNDVVSGGEIETDYMQVCYDNNPENLRNKTDGAGGFGFSGDGTTKYQWFSDASGAVDAIAGATGLSYNPSGPAEQLTAPRSYFRQYTNQCGIANSNTLTILVAAKEAAPMVAVEHQTSCTAIPNGKLTVTAPPAADYEFSKDNGTDFQSSNVFAGLSAATSLKIVARHKITGCLTEATAATIQNKIEESRPLASIKVFPRDSVCVGAHTVGLKAVVSQAGVNPTFLWNHGLPSQDSVSVTPPSRADGMQATTYTLMVVNKQTACTTKVAASKAVYVFAPLQFGQQPQGGSVCVDSAENRVLSVRLTDLSAQRKIYQWQKSVTIDGTYSPIAGATNPDYTVPTHQASAFYYRCVVAREVSVCDEVTSDAVLFTVIAPPALPLISPADQYICEGSSATLTTAAPAPGITLSWSTNAGGGNSPSVVVSPAAQMGIADAPSYYSLTASNGVCALTSAPAVVRVSRKQSINHQGDESLHSQQICQGAPLSTISHSVAGGASQSVKSPMTWRNPKGASSPPPGITITWSQGDPIEIKGNIAPTADTGVYVWTMYTVGTPNNVCPADSSSGSIRVGLTPAQTYVNAEVSGNNTACSEFTLNASGGVGGTIYWQNTTANGSSTTTPSLSQKITSSGTYYFRALSAHGCWGPAGSRALTIHVPPIITLQPSSRDTTITLYTESFPSLSVVVSGSALSYQWYRNSSPSNTGGVAVGINAPTYKPTTDSIGPYWFYCVVSNAHCTTTSSVSGRHQVNCSQPLITTQGSLNQSVVRGGCVAIEALAHSVVGGKLTTISWTGPQGTTNAPLGISASPTSISGIPASNALPGLYTWTVRATNLRCAASASGTLRVDTSVVILANTEQTIDGVLYVADHEGNTYPSVLIGTQRWTTENMRATTSPTGVDWVQKGPADARTASLAHYYARADKSCYGVLYNWAAANDVPTADTLAPVIGLANHRGVCPSGWHVSTAEDWCTLEKHLDPSMTTCPNSFTSRGNYASRLAEALLWNEINRPNAPGNYRNNSNQNETGLSLLPSGLFYKNGFDYQEESALFWLYSVPYTSDPRYGAVIDVSYDKALVTRFAYTRDQSYAVRCVKN